MPVPPQSVEKSASAGRSSFRGNGMVCGRIGWLAGILFLMCLCSAGETGRAQNTQMPGAPSAPGQTAQEPARTPGASHTAAPNPNTNQNPSGTPANPTTSTAPMAVTPERQNVKGEEAANQAQSVQQAKNTLAGWKGLRVNAVEFDGVKFTPKDPLPGRLPQQAGQPLDPEKVTASIRQLFASGRYRDISLQGRREANGVRLIFAGVPRYFVGRVAIDGVRDERLASLLEYATKLQPGAPYSDADLQAGTAGVEQSLQDNGFFQATVHPKTELDLAGNQMNVTYVVNVGPQARIGQVNLQGKDPGFTPEEFRKKAKLKKGKKVTRDTVSNALTNIRTQYQKKDRLEATATLEKQTYNPPRKQLDYQFNASEGPLVKVVVEGAKISKNRLKLLIPIYQEGTIDNDLLNEGSFNIKDFLFQQGYFDAKVTVRVVNAGQPSESVVFSVDKGQKRKVGEVTITGNKYFKSDLFRERMQVQKADLYMRSGRYSPQLMKSDENSILNLYRANGFSKATINTTVKDVDRTSSGKKLKVPEIDVHVAITEGPQQKFGAIGLDGVDASRAQTVRAMMNSQTGQPYSLITLSGDRDAILNYYLSQGFSQARVNVRQHVSDKDPNRMDVTLEVVQGSQFFVDKVLVSGDVHTKPSVVRQQVTVRAGDPLDQSALLDTQRKLYDLALFNQVNVASQNPDGDDPLKNVVLQLTEARRWDVTYGFGFEAETGTPPKGKINPASAILLGLPPNAQYSQNGRTGVSPRVSLDVSRINLRGTDESLTLHTTYGLLEEVAMLSFQNPRFFGNEQLSSQVSGGYSNVQNITTFQASTLQGDFRINQKHKKTDTFIYDFQYRRVAVNPSTLQVSANLIPQLSQPVRVGGPGITWFHDTRDPSPLDAVRGTYTSVQDFFAYSTFGSQTSFNRTDISNSNYWQFGKHHYVFARNTRLGFEAPFGSNPNVSSPSCSLGNLLNTNPSCNPVPLPERLYAGGATSHRGFGINDAGPRDLQTGYPVGGNAVFVNSFELRLPPPTLPVVGQSVSFVLFHDMGNVFMHVSDMFPSFARFHQPHQETCARVSPPYVTSSYPFGTCDFNYFSHAVGLGARYKTPVGPIRVDFSYNLNPPVYPVVYDFNGAVPHEGQAGHFNFFFSIGQAF